MASPHIAVSVTVGTRTLLRVENDQIVSERLQHGEHFAVLDALGRAVCALAGAKIRAGDAGAIRHAMAMMKAVASPESMAIHEELEAVADAATKAIDRASNVLAGDNPSIN